MKNYPQIEISELVCKVSKCNPKDYKTDFFEYIDISSINRDTKKIEETTEVSVGDAPSRARQIVSNGDVLVSTVRPNLNAVAQVPNSLDDEIASTGFSILRSDKSKLHNRYLFHWVKNQNFISYLLQNVTGANYPAVSDKVVKSAKIPLPPLAEQKRIAEVLDKADALREKRRLALQKLDTLLQSVFLEMFGDPVKNPMGWKSSPLGLQCGVGSSKRVFVDELVENGIPFYRGTEIGKLGADQSVDPSLFITKEHYERLKAQTGVPQIGDLLLPSICPDGRIYLVNDDNSFYFKDGRVLWIKVDRSKTNSIFLKYHLKQLFFANYSKIASGTTFAELKIFALNDLDIHIPPIELQNKFSETVKKIQNIRNQKQISLNQIENLFQSLQQKAFNGELFEDEVSK